MTTFKSETIIHVPAKTVMKYLSEVQNLPHYFPRVTSAKKTSGGKVDVTAQFEDPSGQTHEVEAEAWIKADEAGQKLTWGSLGPNNYTGEVNLESINDKSCRAVFSIVTDRKADNIQAGVDEAVRGIKDAAEKDAD